MPKICKYCGWEILLVKCANPDCVVNNNNPSFVASGKDMITITSGSISSEIFTQVALVCDGSSGDMELEKVVASAMQEYFQLWKQKQRSYGPHNIGAFGAQGCLIRANDKIQRLRRHYFLNKDVSLSDESIEDTWKDGLGYFLMGLICHRGQWPGIEK